MRRKETHEDEQDQRKAEQELESKNRGKWSSDN